MLNEHVTNKINEVETKGDVAQNAFDQKVIIHDISKCEIVLNALVLAILYIVSLDIGDYL